MFWQNKQNVRGILGEYTDEELAVLRPEPPSGEGGDGGEDVGYGEANHFVKGDDGWYDEELGAYLSNDQKVALMYSDYDGDGYDVAVIEYLEPLKEIKIKNK